MPKKIAENGYRTVERFLADAAPYIVEPREINKTESTEITVLAIRAFKSIVTMCQEELNDSDEDHLKYVLRVMCRIDVEGSGQELCTQFQGFISHHIEYLTPLKEGENRFMAVGEQNLLVLIKLKDYGTKLRTILVSYIAAHQKKHWYQFYRSVEKYRWAQEALAEVEASLDRINHRLEHDSDKMIHKIVDNFYIIYICLLALIKYAKLTGDLTLELSVSAQIDRILQIIDPSFQAQTLQNKYLLYYHVVYELKELYNSVLSDM